MLCSSWFDLLSVSDESSLVTITALRMAEQSIYYSTGDTTKIEDTTISVEEEND